MIKKYSILFLPLLGGLAAIFLRRWQLQSAFEPSGLPISGALATYVLSFFSLLVAVLLLLLSVRHSKDASLARVAVGENRPSFVGLLLTSAAAILTLIAPYFTVQSFQLLRLTQKKTNFLLLLFAVLCIFAAASFFLIAKQRYQGRSLTGSALLLFPAFASCLWLMTSYQEWAKDPFVTDYMFAMFAIITGTLAHYFIAAHAFQKNRTALILLTAGLSVFFSLIALTSSTLNASTCLYTAQILYFVPTMLLLLNKHASLQAIAPSEGSSLPIIDPTKEEPT